MTQHYVGSELELFSTAANWKSYFSEVIGPFVGGRVLEVRAGIGANIPYLYGDQVEEWTSLEPDPDLAARIGEGLERGTLPAPCRGPVGTLRGVDAASPYDTILSPDVLEP